MTTPIPARVQRSESWRRAFIAQHGARCHYCNRTGSLDEGPGQRPWHIDHMEPIARGGADDENNLTLACKRCNLTKHVQPYKDFSHFARAAFWQVDDEISQGEMDALMDEWSRSTGDGERLWLVARGEVFAVVSAPSSSGPGEYLDLDIMRTEQFAPEGPHAARFLVSAHRLVPQLIAEVRQLRALNVEDAS